MSRDDRRAPSLEASRRTVGPRSSLARRAAMLALLASLVTTVGAAFVLLGVSWPPPHQITMRTGGLNQQSCGGNCQTLALSAMNSWNAFCSPDPDFDWNRSTASGCVSCGTQACLDNINCTEWENLGQCSSGTVTLGVTYIWFSGSTIVETDVSMNSSCNFNSSTFLGVLSHEDGHVMGLGHSQVSGALMAALFTGTTTPQADDCNGARALYPPNVTNYTLNVSKSGTGTVTSSPSGINCGSTCSAAYAQNTVVTLSANPASGWTFSSWSGNSDCTDGKVTMNANKSCTANFTRIQYTLSVSKTGSGTVTSSPSGINCGSTCSSKFNSSTKVTLTPTPAVNWAFVGWSGQSDCDDGKVTMNSNRSCTANFKRLYKLTVTKSGGSGSGTVTSSPTGINCGGDCDEDYLENTVVYLSGKPVIGSQFTAWTGASDCSDGIVTMNQAKTCNAVFDTCATQSEVTIKDTDITTTMTVTACNKVHVGPNVTITSTGYLTIHAGNSVTLYRGVTTDSNGKLGTILGQPLPPP